MTDSTPKSVGNGNLKPFKKGYDPRRWLKGRGKKTPEQREGEKILLAVIWDELSREFDPETGRPITPDENLDALRLMVRSMIKKKSEVIIERIAGKVVNRTDVTTNGEKLVVEIIGAKDGKETESTSQ